MTALDTDPAAEGALECRDLVVSYEGATAVDRLSLHLRPGSITTLVGPNGSGKSSALNALARILKPAGGAVHLDGRDIGRHSTREVALRLALLPQSATVPASVTVRELIGYGRYPHQGLFGSPSAEDREAVDWAISATALQPLTDRAVDSLSGGERQRTWIAMALAQRTRILLLDEPTTFLDVRHQLEVLRLVRRLNREHGLTVGMVLHDLNQAAEFSDFLVMLRAGRLVAQGAPAEVIDPAHIRAVFDLEAQVMPHPVTATPLCIPINPLEETPHGQRTLD